MSQQYWVRGPAGQRGPFDQLQIRGLVAIGELTPTMEISPDAKEWRVASSVRGLFPEPKIDPMQAFSASAVASTVPGSFPPPAAAPPVRPPPLPAVNPYLRAAVDSLAEADQHQAAVTKPISEKWHAIFAAFDKAGGLRFTNMRDLSSTERRYVTFNSWAFVFGPLWYIAKGMWKRGFTILFFTWASLIPLIIILIELVPNTPRSMLRIDSAIPITMGAIFAAFANRDYYKFVRLGWRPSWKWLGLSLASLIVVVVAIEFMPNEWTPKLSGLVATPQPASARTVPAAPKLPPPEAAPSQAAVSTKSQVADAALSLNSLQLGNAISADGRLVNSKSIFTPFDTIYAVAQTDATRPATLSAIFTYQGNQLVFSDAQQIRGSGPSVTRFHIEKPNGFPTGTYAIELSSDGKSIGRANFEVR